MKKLVAIILSIVSAFTIFAFSACSTTENPTATPQQLSVYCPDGAPALSIAKFIADSEDFGTGAEMSYHVVAASSIGQVVQTGTGDIVILPINAASKLYAANASDPYKMAGVITHGNLYVMSKQDLTIEDLKGKVVGVIGQGNVPDLTFKAVLSDANIEYAVSDAPIDGKVALKYYADGSELVPALKTGKIAIGLLPEPAANKLKSLDGAFKYALDLQTLYDSSAKAYPQAAVMIKTSVLNAYPELATAFGNKIADNVAWVKTNPADAVNAIAGVLPEGVAKSFTADNLNSTVVDNCKIYWQDSASAKQSVKAYINAIIAIEQQSAKAVADDFFA